MMTSGKKRRFAQSPLLLAAVLGLAGTASGCIIDGSGGGHRGGSCAPDLFVYWQLEDANRVPVTCAAAQGGWVQAMVNGEVQEVACPPASATSDPFLYLLPSTGWYDVNVRLLHLDGNTELSGTSVNNPPEIFVDCSGRTSTPTVFLCVGAGCAPVAYKGDAKTDAKK